MKVTKRDLRLLIVPGILLMLFFAFNVSIGPTVIIETEVPAEDFVVLCKKNINYLIGHNASSYTVVDKVFVAKSGEKIKCGIMFFGESHWVNILHPVYTGDGKENYEKDGVKHIVYNKTKLDLLEEQKAKFEAGYWDGLPVPGWEVGKTSAQRYARSVGGCGFGHRYLEYYNKVEKIDKNYFMKKYNAFFIKCNQYGKDEAFSKNPALRKELMSFEKVMELIWDEQTWGLYE